MEVESDIIPIVLVGVGALLTVIILIWISNALFGKLLWLSKYMCKISIYMLLWSLFAMMIWNWTQEYMTEPPADITTSCGTGTTCGIKKEQPPPPESSGLAWLWRSRTPAPPPPPEEKPPDSLFYSEEVKNLARMTASIWKGDLRGVSPWGMTKTLIWGTYRVTTSGMMYGVKTIVNKAFPVMHSVENKIWTESIHGKQIKTCGVTCEISGTDCAGDAACLCTWSDVRQGGQGVGFSTIWEPCREKNTKLPVGVCICPSEQ